MRELLSSLEEDGRVLRSLLVSVSVRDVRLGGSSWSSSCKKIWRKIYISSHFCICICIALKWQRQFQMRKIQNN